MMTEGIYRASGVAEFILGQAWARFASRTDGFLGCFRVTGLGGYSSTSSFTGRTALNPRIPGTADPLKKPSEAFTPLKSRKP